LVVLLAFLLLPGLSFGGCKTDCLDDYESERDNCLLTYDDPYDSDVLQLCLEDAKAAYDDCIEQCDQ